jgi:RHS repeat-associated protein
MLHPHRKSMKRGLLTSVHAAWAGSPGTYSYDAAGRLTETNIPNDVDTTRTDNSTSRLMSITHVKQFTMLQSITYTYDPASNRLTLAVMAGTTTIPASTVQQGVVIPLTVEAKTTGGTVLTGWRGTVQLAASNGSVLAGDWGAEVDRDNQYTFAAADAGRHSFSPKFSLTGDQTVTVSHAALPARQVTTNPITVTSGSGGGGGGGGSSGFSHDSAPAGVTLADGSTLWAYLGIRGRLYVRKNGGTLGEPAWRAPVLVRELAAGDFGADSPTLVRFAGKVALFHTYVDGLILQVWVTTSTDDGATWGTPVKLTSEAIHVQRVQAVVSGSTLYLFFSRQDTSGSLFYRTTSDLVSWSATATVGRAIGQTRDNTTSNFGIARLASGQWLLGWVAPSAAGEPPNAPAGSTIYPTVQAATSGDLATGWSAPVELTLAYSQRGATSVAVGQDAGTGLMGALFEQFAAPADSYIAQRTSSNGTSWNAQALVGYDRSAAANGGQQFLGAMPAYVAGSLRCAFSVEVGTDSGQGLQGYGRGAWSEASSGTGVQPLDCAAPAETLPMPYGDGPQTVPGAGTAVTGYLPVGGAELSVPARQWALGVSRSYRAHDAVTGQGGPFGFGWHWTYGVRAVTHADGSVSIIEADGRRSIFWKTGSTWTAGPSINATLAAGSGGVGYALTRHDQSVWRFDGSGRLTSVTDRNGNALTLTYAGSVLSSVTAPGGRSLTITSDGQGRITSISAPGGLSASYTYDGNGNLATATNAAGEVTRYTYDGRHQLLTVTDGRNVVVATITYGTLGRVRQAQDGANGVTAYAPAKQGYAGSWGSLSAVTDARGNQTQYANDTAWRVTQRDGYEGSTTLLARSTFGYNANGDVTSSSDPNGRVTTTTYDERGNVLTRTLDAGTGGLNLTSAFIYNATNDLLTSTDPLNRTTTHTYSAQGNRLTTTNPLNQTTTFAYDGFGQLTSVTDATNRTTAYGYSVLGDRTSVTLAPNTGEAATTTYIYNDAGRQTGVLNPVGQLTSFTYDGLGRVLTTTNALNQTTSYQYDAAGNRTRVTDPLGRSTTYAYDALSRLTTVTDAQNGVTRYAYDQNGNRTSTTNALGRGWTDSYDALNRRISSADPLGNTTTHTYDAAGTLTQTRKPDGTLIGYSYDRVYRRTGITPGGGPAISFAYDGAGRRTSMTDATGTTTFGYDQADRLTSVAAPVTGTVGYSYDAAGRRVSLTYPSGHVVTYAYTARGELASVSAVWAGGTTSYGYDAASRPRTESRPNTVETTREYDAVGRLTRLDHRRLPMSTLETFTYSYDGAGNRLEEIGASTYATFSYDGLNRLVGATYAGSPTSSYGYDAAGNRTSLSDGAGSTTYSYDAANRLTAAGGDTYTFDANGNQLTRTSGGVTTTFAYDALDRMTGISGPATASYTYNGLGLRVRVTVGGVTASTAWDLAADPPQQLVEGTVEFVRGLGNELLAAAPLGGGATTVAADALGSPRLVTDASGTVVGSTQYDAFGAVKAQSGTQAQVGFTGEQQDSESGLVYLRARYYDPRTGRFLSADPVPGEHPYVYANNNPLRFIDPTGRKVGGTNSTGGYVVVDVEIGYTYISSLLAHLALRTVRNGRYRYYEGIAQCGAWDCLLTNPGKLIHHIGDRPGLLGLYVFVSLCGGDGACQDKLANVEQRIGIDRLLTIALEYVSGLYDYNALNGPNSNSIIYFLISELGIKPRGDAGSYFFPNLPSYLQPVVFPGWKNYFSELLSNVAYMPEGFCCD